MTKRIYRNSFTWHSRRAETDGYSKGRAAWLGNGHIWVGWSFDEVEEVDRMEVEEEETEHDEVVLKEVIIDSDLILQLLKNISVQDTLDNHSNWLIFVIYTWIIDFLVTCKWY